MINRLEVDAEADRGPAEGERRQEAGREGAADLDKKMMDVELQLLSRTDLHSDDKWYVEAYKVYLNLVWLFGDVGTGAGDVAGRRRLPADRAAVQILDMLEKELAEARAAFNTLVNTDVPAFNKAMAGKVPAVTDTMK